jgi:glycosyltransferase involved in cell wall biosynthesis
VPKVSVVTPSYNHNRFLTARFSSIQAQTYRDFEWIIIDDCSTDGSQERLAQMVASEPRARLVVHDRNKGMASTVNEAIDASSGAYVYRAESDDFCRPALLEHLVTVLDAHHSVGIVHGRTLNLDPRGRAWPDIGRGRHAEVTTGERAFGAFALANTVAGPTTMMRREALETAGGFAIDPCGIACDWHFLLRVCLRYDVGYVDEPLAFHRLHERNFSRAGEPLLWERYRIIADVFDRLPEERASLRTLQAPATRAISHRAGVAVYLGHLARGHPKRAATVRTLIEERDPGSTSGPSWRRACWRSAGATALVRGAYPRVARLMRGEHLEAAASDRL